MICHVQVLVIIFCWCPAILLVLMCSCNVSMYSCNSKYQFSYTKTSVVAFVNLQLNIAKISKLETGRLVQTTWIEDEYVNLGVYKNYCGSFSKNLDENIAKTRKKAGMLFLTNFVGKCVNSMIYLKFWK